MHVKFQVTVNTISKVNTAIVSLLFRYCFAIISLLFRYYYAIVSLLFPYCFAIISLLFRYYFAIISLLFRAVLFTTSRKRNYQTKLKPKMQKSNSHHRFQNVGETS